MLKRALLAVSLLLVPFVAPAATFGAPAECKRYSKRIGECTIFIDPPERGGEGSTPGNGGGNDGRGGKGGGGGGSGGGEDEVDPGNDLYKPPEGTCRAIPVVPQPPFSDPVWGGRRDGAIYECTNVLDDRSTRGRFWLPTPGAPGDEPIEVTPPPDPAELARDAIARMRLSAIEIGIVPEDAEGRVGIIGMPTWMWVADPDEHTVGPITRTASSAGYTVTATARLDRIVWTMGDGSTVTCRGSGTPYTDAAGDSPSPTCGHTYTTSGKRTVGATSHWNIAWRGIGQTGTIPMTFTQSTTITMGEVQVLVQ